MSVGSQSLGRKRGRLAEDSGSDDCRSPDRGSDDAPASKVIVVEEEQSRGRAPTTEHNVGLAEAEVALEALQRAEVELQDKRELAEETRSHRSPRVVLSRISESERARDITGCVAVATGKKPATANTRERRPPLDKLQPGASWVEVTKRGKKGGPAVTSVPSQGTQSQARAERQRKPEGGKDKVGQPRLRAPTSSAIVLTIQSKGAEGGLTYVKSLTEARQNVDLASL
ncbi:Gag protein [Operophtera brumata]|uniref:Gag protein n=1 Tax=Operophtera brumata TaxID=104452 RepID=A0A0L7L6K8_OPEBR|nr:Gag protein [Operophtera brumata]